jgi:hypothetical protein
MGYLRYQLVGVRRSFAEDYICGDEGSFAEDYICGDEGYESGYGLASIGGRFFYRLVPLDIRWRVCGG